MAIKVYFNESGYHIRGDGLEIIRSCSSRPEYEPIHHLYHVLILALSELVGKLILEEVIVSNDSRLVEEINGILPPLDESCRFYRNILLRNIIPNIHGIVLFRKKSGNIVNKNLAAGQCLLADQSLKEKAFANIVQEYKEKLINQKQKLIKKFKRSWFDERT